MAPGNGRVKLSKSLDVYRKVDPDLTRSTPVGAFLSVVCICIMLILFVLEVQDYWTSSVTVEVTLDPGNENDDLQFNFNITVERVACPYIALELHNHLGTHSLNITRNIARYKIKTKDSIRHTIGLVEGQEARRVLIDDTNVNDSPEESEVAPHDLTTKDYEGYISQYDVVLVNFFAPWCVWSKRLEPVWVSAAHEMSREFGRHRVAVAWVDCTRSDQVELCHRNHIGAFPTIVSFRGGDTHTVDHYHGERSVAALKEFAREELSKTRRQLSEMHPDELALQAAELADKMDGDGKYTPAVEGCRLEGFVLAPKVPSTLVFATHMPDQSIDAAKLNVSHEIHHLSFGAAELRKSQLREEMILALSKLDGRKFESRTANLTHEHFLKIVGSSFKRFNEEPINFYKYLHYASPFHASSSLLPTIKFHFDITPMHVVTIEKSKPFYRFITNLFAIVGGTFTVFGLLDAVFDNAQQALKRKVELGKAS